MDFFYSKHGLNVEMPGGLISQVNMQRRLVKLKQENR